MKNTKRTEQEKDMLPEYNFDYSKAKSNRFAAIQPEVPVIITLDPDVAKIFSTSEAVNHALRAILTALPHSQISELNKG